MKSVARSALPRIDSRIGFLYLHRCVVSRDGGALTARRETGTIHIPVSSVNVILLGPGTSVTHQAVALLAEAGTLAVWVGDGGGVWYAAGRPLASGTSLLRKQAEVVSDTGLRLAAAKRMYATRFGDESMDRESSIRDMQLHEGRLVKELYRSEAQRTGITWTGRVARRGNHKPDAINSALSLAHSCLYSVCHSVILSLGLSPGLGVVHQGNHRSFTLDIADLYKHRVSIPVAFDAVALSDGIPVPASVIRENMRDKMFHTSFFQNVVSDIVSVLSPGSTAPEIELEDTNSWWDGSC